ncbi:uncharacterized protein ACB058_014418 [Synchiropus picturatus]
MWLLQLHLLMVGCFCRSFVEQKTEVLGSMISLKCLDTTANLSWTRNEGGSLVDLVGFRNGREIRRDGFGVQADHALVIVRAKLSDTALYLCNGKPAVNLKVIDPSEVSRVPSPAVTRPWTLTPTSGTLPSSDFLWRVPVGVAGGLALLLVLVLIVWFKRKTEEPESEQVYEEIQDKHLQPPQSAEQSYAALIYVSSDDHLYDTVPMEEDAGVYSLAHDPVTGTRWEC